MRPLTEFDPGTAKQIAVVMTDIDDTLTEHGRLPARAYGALERLKAAGLIVVPVTGRPAGWCDLIARQWPVDGVVGENGAFWFRYEDTTRRMIRKYQRTAAQRDADRAGLERIAAEVLRDIAGAAISADQDYRSADLAIDFCEDVPRLSGEAVARIVEIFERHGAHAKVSSIHVNGWFGDYDKLSTSLGLLRDVFGIATDDAPHRVVFTGDSPNDAPMFAHFPKSVGVANVADFAAQMPALPGFVTRARSAEGFAEFVEHLLAVRA